MAVCVERDGSVKIARGTAEEVQTQLLQFVALAKGKLILLQHRGDPEHIGEPQEFGWQPALLSLRKDPRKGMQATFTPKTTSEGKPWTRGQIQFTQDRFGYLQAYVPATEYNIRRMASCIYSETNEWEILDSTDREMVEAKIPEYVKQFAGTEYEWHKPTKLVRRSHREEAGEIEPPVATVEKTQEAVVGEPADAPAETKRGPGRPKKGE
jgi:hypothetical protein